jgi:RNA polymerase sigma-70 factor (ECF subfamily)
MAKAAPSRPSASDPEVVLSEQDRATAFERHRPVLRGLAYRMLGSVAEAEDAVQDCYLRWRRVDPATLSNERAWLLTATTRLCIDRLRAARARRETYIGPWLPEPILAEPDDFETAGLASSLSTAMLLLLERLSPAERAAFLLREAFECDYAEIAEALDRNEAACRQLVRRARARLQAPERRFQPDPEAHRRLLESFGAAVASGDVAGLKAMLAEQVQLHSDGGGRVLAARNVIHGPDHVARFLVGIWRKQHVPLTVEMRGVNGGPGLIASLDGRVVGVLALDVADGLIRAVHFVNNPDKLAHLQDGGI